MRERAVGRRSSSMKKWRVCACSFVRGSSSVQRLAVARSFDRRGVGIVALEVIRVELDAPHAPFGRELARSPSRDPGRGGVAFPSRRSCCARGRA